MPKLLRSLPPDVVLTDIHKLAEELGAQRLRIDRSGWSEGAAVWIEVGYASGEIHVRTSIPKLRYRREVADVDMDEVLALFEALLNGETE